jgi:hypothetical protein
MPDYMYGGLGYRYRNGGDPAVDPRNIFDAEHPINNYIIQAVTKLNKLVQ